MPNAIDPTAAQINIAKFNTSVIIPPWFFRLGLQRIPLWPSGNLPAQPRESSLRFSQKNRRVDP